MSEWDRGLLAADQREFVVAQLGVPRLVDDLSWGLVDTRVLHVRTDDGDYMIKAAPPGNHHIGREATAHEGFTAPLVQADRTGRLIAADRSANALIMSYQSGTLVEGTPEELDPDVHHQAGMALRLLHDQSTASDDEHEAHATARAIAWLDGSHRIAPDAEAKAREILRAYRPGPVAVVPTHGDWQPRNWLIDDGWVRVIDFGRFALRPAATDLCRLAVQQWRSKPELEAAFIAGYGTDPRDGTIWPLDLLREAIGTAAWAHQVGDLQFEAQGHRMLTDALTRF